MQMFTGYDGEAARLVAKRVARAIRRHYSTSVVFKHYRVSNLQVVSRLPFRVDLQSFTQCFSEVVPPALGDALPPFRVVECTRDSLQVQIQDDGRTVVRIFQSGTLKVFKARALSDAIASMESLLPALRRHSVWW